MSLLMILTMEILFPVFNQLVYISEQRAFDIQQTDYRDRFTVFNTIKSERGLEIR